MDKLNGVRITIVAWSDAGMYVPVYEDGEDCYEDDEERGSRTVTMEWQTERYYDRTLEVAGAITIPLVDLLPRIAEDLQKQLAYIDKMRAQVAQDGR